MRATPLRQQSERGKKREAGLRSVRDEVMQRTAFRCEACSHYLGPKGGIQHHVFRRRIVGALSHDPALLTYICTVCHDTAHQYPNQRVDDWLQRQAVERLTGKVCVFGEVPIDAVRAYARERGL